VRFEISDGMERKIKNVQKQETIAGHLSVICVTNNLYILSHFLFLSCDSRSEHNTPYKSNIMWAPYKCNITWLIFLVEAKYVLWEVGNDFFDVTEMRVGFQSKKWIKLWE